MAENQWYRDGLPVSGETADSLLLRQTGVYTVLVTGDNGCTNVSDPFDVTVLRVEALHDGMPTLSLYPNPAREYCKIQVLAGNGIGSVELFDLTGKQVRRMPYGFFRGHNEIIYNLDDVMEGLYFIRITLPDGENLMSKILVQ